MNRWPVFVGVGFPLLLMGIILIRYWLLGDAGLQKPDGDLSDPDDLTLTKLRLNESEAPRQDTTLAE
jgi:hypothetical protein